jgi:cytoskeletal protein CcmA (bactofilin family)
MSSTASAFANPNAVIGKTIVIKGDIQSHEPLTIEGRVEGTIEIGEHLLTVAPGADVRAQISGRSVEVRGRVEGLVEAAQTVYIRTGAEFIGDLHASSLVIEEGSYIKANIELTRSTADSAHKSFAEHSGFNGSEAIRELSHSVLAS